MLWDFCFYWLHRLHHKFELLWAVHVVHHEGEHFSLSLGIRNSWYSSLTSFPFFLGMALIGVPLEIFIITSSIHYTIQFYNHNRIVKNSGWLEKIMITPAHHRVHHGSNPEYVDTNFGGTFIFWDKLFGTFQRQLDSVPIIYGTKDYVRSHNVVWANNLPFLKMFNFSNLKKEKKLSVFKLPDAFIAIGGILLFGLLVYYIFQEDIWNNSMKFFFFNIIFLGTIGAGGLSEGKHWGLVISVLNFLFLAPSFVIYHQVWEPLLLINLGLLALHSFFIFVSVAKGDEKIIGSR